jgi:hypothetical protein
MITARYLEALPPHIARVVWLNVTADWLRLEPPGAAEPIALAPGCSMQIAAAQLATAPMLEAWIEGLELRGMLRRLDG